MVATGMGEQPPIETGRMLAYEDTVYVCGNQ